VRESLSTIANARDRMGVVKEKVVEPGCIGISPEPRPLVRNAEVGFNILQQLGHQSQFQADLSSKSSVVFNDTVLRAATMTSLPSPPFIDIPGIANFRGVGQGYVGPGLLYRSADPTRATSAGLEKMSKDLGKVSHKSRSAVPARRCQRCARYKSHLRSPIETRD